MRISDWSSDVCSSDLVPKFSPAGLNGKGFMPTAKRLIKPLLSMVDRFVAVNVTLLARALPDWPGVPLGVAAVPAASDASSTIWLYFAATPRSTIRLAEPQLEKAHV